MAEPTSPQDRKTRQVKAEPTSPQARKTVRVKGVPNTIKAASSKRKLEVYIGGSEIDYQGGMSVGGSIMSSIKGGKQKQLKASGSQSQVVGAFPNTRKSSRLKSGADTASKKARTESSQPEESAEALIRRLASQFAEIGKTYEVIAERMRD